MRNRPKLAVSILLLVVVALALVNLFRSTDKPHNPRVFGPPDKTNWKPVGARPTTNRDSDVIPDPTTFNAIHVGVLNSDAVWGVAAPMFELDWVAEPAYFVGNGPLLDNHGNLYFSPQFYKGERVLLISLDGKTGERRWAIPASDDMHSSSPAFILNDPDHPGEQIIYVIGYGRAMALRTDGTEVWRTSTGLDLPPLDPNLSAGSRVHSFNYHSETDSLVTVSKRGELFAFDRKTGKMLLPVGQLPGAPALSERGTKIPGFVVDRVDPIMDEAFGKNASGRSLFSSAVNYIYGGGGIVTNYFSIDPQSSRIYIAATAEDAEDGKEDGRSELGAIYLLDLVRHDDETYEFKILNRITFQGGTGSTPALSVDGERIYVSDNTGHVIALDSQLQEIWRIDIGEPLVGSITVAADNNELYAVTRKDVIQLMDKGEFGTRTWTAELTGFDGYANVDKQTNSLTATATANGVVIGIGGGKSLLGFNLMLHIGMGLLDRETGKLRYFAEGREDSLAMSIVGADGSIYVAHSPLRRAVGKAMYPDLTADVTGGISRFKPIRLDLLARDAICAAQARAANTITLDWAVNLRAIEIETRQINFLLGQAGSAINQAINDGDMTEAEGAKLEELIGKGDVQLNMDQLTDVTETLSEACAYFE